MRSHFNPRAPCGARPRTGFLPPTVDQFQSTRPLRGATGGRNFLPPFSVISIHAPLAGRDEHTTVSPFTRSLFQSTRPLRGATAANAAFSVRPFYFNPRAPCGARRWSFVESSTKATISIHAPLAGRDLFGYADFTTPIIFQSTRPLRGATLSVTRLPMAQCHFNPRAPCGARPPPCLASCATSHISIHAPLAGRDRFPRVRQC